MKTWRDCLVIPDDGVRGSEGHMVVLPHEDRTATVLAGADPLVVLALGWYSMYTKIHAMTHPEFTAYFGLLWPKRDTHRAGPNAEKWEVAYECLLTEYQARATSLNGLTPPGMTREEFRTLWETPGKGDAAYAAAVQGAFNATEVTGD